MTLASDDPRMDKELLDDLIVAYLEAMEKGQQPDAQEWLNRYPQLAADLAAFFADQEKIQRWTAPLRQVVRAAPSSVLDPNPTEDYGGDPWLQTRLGPFGDYVLVEELGRGGMGVVYKARQLTLDRLVAIKMILAGHLASPTDVQSFQTEAVAAACLDHPHIVPIYEVGKREGQFFYSMKLMEGGTLAEHAAELSQRPREVAALMIKVARAVHHAHQRGILHRDLKPGNVLLDALGEPHVSDFGLAKRMEDLSQSSVVVGTPCYMAPEHACGQKGWTTAADIYSLGAILYAMLTCQPPFRGQSRQETLQLAAEQPPTRPRALRPDVNRDLETICLKCLEKSPADRYASAEALAEDLQRYLAGEPIRARVAPLWVRVLKWAKRRPALTAWLTVCVVTVCSLIAGYVQYQQKRASDAERTLNERLRTESVRTEVQGRILQGQQAMSQGLCLEAKVHLASAQGLLAREPALGDLRPALDRLFADADECLRQEAARRAIHKKYAHFMTLRARALFQATLLPDTDLAVRYGGLRATVEEALGLFALAVEDTGAPAFAESVTPDERNRLAQSCHELLLILAEAAAQDHPPQLRQALRILERAKQFRPHTRAYHLQRGRYLKQLGDEEGAAEASRQSAALPPTEALDYFHLGQDLHRQGELAQAIDAFHKALDRQPDHFWARYFLAVSYLRLQPSRADLASDNLTACLGQGRDLLWVYLLRGIARGQLEQFQAAEEDFQKALDGGPDQDARYAVFLNRGVVYSRQRKFVQALSDLQRAISLEPKKYQAYVNLAQVYQQQQQGAAALAQWRKAIALATPHVPAKQRAQLYRNLARLQLASEDFEAALQAFRQAIALEPSARDHADCGRILQGLRRFPQAAAAYETALQVDPDHADAHLGRAEALFQLENYQEALRSLDHYLRQPDPQVGPKALAEVYRARGLTRMKLDHYQTALSDFTLALSFQEDSLTLTYRGWANLVNKAPHLALADFERAIRLDKHNSDAYTGRGLVRVKLGVQREEFQAAVADAETALSQGSPNRARLLWNAARIYAQAAARLEAARDVQALRLRSDYQQQAIRLLQQALHVVPSAERQAFWRRNIQADPDLGRFTASLKPG